VTDVEYCGPLMSCNWDALSLTSGDTEWAKHSGPALLLPNQIQIAIKTIQAAHINGKKAIANIFQSDTFLPSTPRLGDALTVSLTVVVAADVVSATHYPLEAQ